MSEERTNTIEGSRRQIYGILRRHSTTFRFAQDDVLFFV